MKKIVKAWVILICLFLTGPLAAQTFLSYASFNTTSSPFLGGQACGGYRVDYNHGLIYVARQPYCDVYEVSIPAGDNPEWHLGHSVPALALPMATRTLTLIGSYDIANDIGGWFDQQENEFYVDDTHIYFGPTGGLVASNGGIHQWTKLPNGLPGTYLGRVVNSTLTHSQSLGYDANTQTWYGGGDSYSRRIWSWGPASTAWSQIFDYSPGYAGSHHDGMEFVNGYLWISDMTSDKLGQFEYTGVGSYNGWDEVNVFSYSGGGSADDVEGMGFGPMGHFWATGWSTLYELGGNELQEELGECCTGYDDQSLHGWGPCPTPDHRVTVSIDQPGPTGLSTDYYLRAKDLANGVGESSIICGPDDCHGDWSVFFPGGNTALSYYVQILNDGDATGSNDIYYAIDILSSTDRAIFRPKFPITEPAGHSPGWHRFYAPIEYVWPGDPLPNNAYGHWEMDPAIPYNTWGARWNALMIDVVALRFFLDWQPTQDDEIGLDSICIVDSLPIPPKPSLPCCTNFQDDSQLHGWAACPDAPNVTLWLSTADGGGPTGLSTDYYLRAKDDANASAICAPDDCDGDWMGAFKDYDPSMLYGGCGQLCFYYRIFNDGDNDNSIPTPRTPAFTIYNNNAFPAVSATFRGAPMTESDPWTHICAPIYGLNFTGKLPPGWTMNNALETKWELLLSDVTDLKFHFDWNSWQLEEIGLDSICLFPKQCPPACKSIIAIEKTHQTLQGHYQDVSITVEDWDLDMGGFDFLIAYDASALAFTEAEPGQLLEDCGWEYFTYRYGVDGNCGDACPSGLLRIIAIAETNNGPNHPSCYGPPDTDPHELATMTFFVTNDRTYECQYVPIYFFWDDCNDNAISSIDGQILYIDRAIYDFEGNLIWDEDDDDQFPEDERIPFVGAPDFCLNPDPDKPSAERCPGFVNGGIDIVCSDSIDLRGDINCNGLPNEIADAVMFTNYFINGLSAFGDHVEASIAASDVNADGIALSVADLVYQVRVITGDAPPYPKLTPYAEEASVHTSVNHSAVGVSTSSTADIGAGYFVFNHSGYDIGEPQLINGASDMTLKYSDADGILKVLVYSMEKDIRIPAGLESVFAIPIDNEGEIVMTEAQLSDYYGNLLEVTIDKQGILPSEYSLHQNYPNPFNPNTTIFYELPAPSHVRIEVFNVLGQRVATLLDGREEAGIHSVQWDSRSESGSKVSSGIYFYRITSDDFTAEKKMVLMK